MEVNQVHIVEWPKEQAAKLEHNFPKPVDLNMFNSVEKPLNLNLNLQPGQVLPVCIKLCEPICAESNYRVGINLMGQPFIEIVVKGITKIFNCNSKDVPKNPDVPADNPANGPVVIK